MPPTPPSPDLLRELTARVNKRDAHWSRGVATFRCPVHDDQRPSAEWDEDKLVWVCRACGAGGGFTNLAQLLDIELAGFLPERAGKRRMQPGQKAYAIRSQAGDVVAIHHREQLEDGSKRFWWTGPGGEKGLAGASSESLPLYRPERTFPASTGVVVTEGERAADELAEAGYNAVATVCGANATPSDESLAVLLGKRVVLWPDNDDVGRDHMDRVARRLHALGQSCRVVRWEDAPPGGDAADLPDLESGALPLIQAAEQWQPVLYNGSRLRVVGVGRISPGPRPPDLVEGILPARVYTSLLADGGTGKSMLATAIACACAIGGHVGGHKAQQAQFLYLDLEDSQDEFAFRARNIFRGMGVREPFPDIPWASVGWVLKSGAEELADAVEQLGVDAIVVDTVGPAQGASDGAAEKATLEMFSALAPFRGVKTVLFLDHLAKSKEAAKGSQRAIGSIYKGAEVRNSWAVESWDEGKALKHLVLTHSKSNHGPLLDPLGLCWTFLDNQWVIQSEQPTGDMAA